MRDRVVVVLVLSLVLALGGCDLGFIDPLVDPPPPNADPQAGCALGCHGADTSNAPPMSLSGGADTATVAVGAHRAHLDPAPAWHRAVECADCHRVPAEVSSPGHTDDGDRKAEMTFGAVAGGSAAVWNGSSCTTSCHGAASLGGTHAQPTWTLVDGSQATCGSCHSTPPPAPHPADANCATCHPTMEEGSLTFRDPASHINGVVDLSDAGATGGCTTCHGSTNSAPPKDLSGDTASTVAGVGAHQAHLGPSAWHNEITCARCHVVPTTVDAPGHRDGDNLAEVPFDALNPAATYTAATTTCSNLYCHGNGRGNTGTMSWVTPGALACGRCHSVTGNNMSGKHDKHINDENMNCNECHLAVVSQNQQIIAPALHVNGVHEVQMPVGTWNPANRQCSNTGCHGTETW
jgi:predicted CxxxxCH...CXXCH cytochrome family protein